MKKRRFSIHVISFLIAFVCAGAFFSPLQARYSAGLGLFYSYLGVEESSKNSTSSYYFQENNKSIRHGFGAIINFYKIFNMGKYIDIDIGPFFEIGKLGIADDQPVGFSASGSLMYGFGMDIIIRLKPVPVVSPYLKLAGGSEWSSIEWESSSSSLAYTESSFGPSIRILLGGMLDFKGFTLFAEGGIIIGYFASTIDEEHANTVPAGNSYQYLSFRIQTGASIRFGR
ncbi:MAG: hypothetical protein GY754_21205 [bacterium]|nr:hypothetical protein [bacterium]